MFLETIRSQNRTRLPTQIPATAPQLLTSGCRGRYPEPLLHLSSTAALGDLGPEAADHRRWLRARASRNYISATGRHTPWMRLSHKCADGALLTIHRLPSRAMLVGF